MGVFEQLADEEQKHIGFIQAQLEALDKGNAPDIALGAELEKEGFFSQRAESQMLEVEWDEGIPFRVRLRSRWEPVLTWAGPWRSTGAWWEGREPADRYQIVTSVGAVLCEVREGCCYLAGVYD